MNVIDNSNLLQMCKDCGAVGFVPALSYVYDAGAGTVVVTNSSTIPTGDVLNKIKVRVHDFFGGEVRGEIFGHTGGNGYTSVPQVVITGGGGTGATAHAVLTNGVVTSVVVDTPGTGYTSDPVATVVGGGGNGAKLAVTRSTTTVSSIAVVADDNAVTLNVASLDRSKQLALVATILTDNRIAADGGAYGLMAAGNVGYWDVQKNA